MVTHLPSDHAALGGLDCNRRHKAARRHHRHPIRQFQDLIQILARRAPAAAGVIHTDFEKGFIRAETIAYDDYVKFSGEQGAKDAGKMRLEGKEYVVQDGDVMHFLFNT